MFATKQSFGVLVASATAKGMKYVIADEQGFYMAVRPDATKLWGFFYA